MITFFTVLAEWFPRNQLFGEFGAPAGNMIAAVAFFLVVLTLGVAADVGVVIYLIKRPIRKGFWKNALVDRSLPGRMILLILAILILSYLLVSFAYIRIFPAAVLDANAVLFQTLAFHFPVLGILAILFRIAGVRARDLFDIHWKQAPRKLGLAVLLYLAALPLIWFYSLLYQILLSHFGYDFYMQDVVQILAADAAWPMRVCMFFIAIVVAPVFEEVIFRGILLPYLSRRTGFWPAALLLSFLFAGMHIHLPSLLPLFLLSFAFCLAYARTKSLLVPIGMHACFNGVTIVLLLLAGN